MPPTPNTDVGVDLLAIAAHRDDCELTCGGTLARAVRQGHRVGILDLTRGEMGTRGSAELRAEEAMRAAKVLGITQRENLGLPDAGIVNDPSSRELLARAIRRFRPRVVIAPALEGRHPDHRVSAQLIRDACFISGLAKVAPDVPKHRPLKILHTLAYRQDFVRPTFVVDVSDVFELKLEAIRCYKSQFEGETQAGEIYPSGEPLEDVVRHYGAYYGTLIRRRYAEPYFTTEMVAVDDVVSLEVSTF
jgi:bacillithiol biosynthesis deacetylase BshB1